MVVVKNLPKYKNSNWRKYGFKAISTCYIFTSQQK